MNKTISKTGFMLCYDATTLLTCVNSTFTVMHILQMLLSKMTWIAFNIFVSVHASNPWPWHFLRVLNQYLSIYEAPNKHGKKVTYPFLDAKPRYLVENICIRKYFNRQHMKTSITNAKVSSTYENECETHRFHPCWRWAQYPNASLEHERYY